MFFTIIFITLYVLGWLALGFAPWLVLSVITRGNAGLRYLPLCIGAGVAGGLAVPLLFRDDGLGLVLSFAVAFALPTLLLAVPRAAYHFTHPRGKP